MSVKAVNEAYNQICEQYAEMLENIKDLEKEASEGIVEPERVENLREQIEPIKRNYERWTYMMYLLHQPERKSKHARYASQNRALLKKLNSQNSIEVTIKENREALDKMGG